VWGEHGKREGVTRMQSGGSTTEVDGSFRGPGSVNRDRRAWLARPLAFPAAKHEQGGQQESKGRYRVHAPQER